MIKNLNLGFELFCPSRQLHRGVESGPGPTDIPKGPDNRIPLVESAKAVESAKEKGGKIVKTEAEIAADKKWNEDYERVSKGLHLEGPLVSRKEESKEDALARRDAVAQKLMDAGASDGALFAFHMAYNKKFIPKIGELLTSQAIKKMPLTEKWEIIHREMMKDSRYAELTGVKPEEVPGSDAVATRLPKQKEPMRMEEIFVEGKVEGAEKVASAEELEAKVREAIDARMVTIAKRTRERVERRAVALNNAKKPAKNATTDEGSIAKK